MEYDAGTDKRFRLIVIEVGSEPAIESLQAGLLGMEMGERKRIEVPREDLALTYDRDEFEAMVKESAEVSQRIHAKTDLLGKVVGVDDDIVTVGVDPKRSGQILTFEVEVLEIE